MKAGGISTTFDFNAAKKQGRSSKLEMAEIFIGFNFGKSPTPSDPKR